jgi:hypothetical protein
MAPPHRAFERGADDEVNLPDGAAAQRPARVAGPRTAVAEAIPAALQPGVKPLQQLNVHLRRGQLTERRADVDPHQVLVPLPGGVLQLRDLQPLADRLAQRDRRLGVPVLVHLALQPGQRHLGGVVRGRGLAQVALLVGQRVGAGVDDGLEAAGRQGPDVPARAATARGHGRTLATVHCTNPCTNRT